MAIKTLREGDLVVARNEDTGQSGTFPVTALMAHQASEVLWLTLESEDGAVTRMGVTANHPLFIAGIGWGDAGELVAGDAIRDSMLKELTVLAVEVDTTPQMVHNLEIAEAHTYFAGELEAWGHNRGFYPPNPPNPSKVTVNGVCYISNFPNDHGPAYVHVSGGGSSTRATFFGGGVDGTDSPLTPKQRKGLCDPKVRKLLRNAAKWVKYYANR